MKILVLLPLTSQPRFIKRIQYLIDDGHDVTVAYQIRDYFKKNHLPEDCTKVPLVKVESEKHYKRIYTSLASICILLRKKENFDIIYSFSIDLLLVSLFIKTDKRIYEIGDYRRMNMNLFHIVYRRMLQTQDRIIVTSLDFKKLLIKKYGIVSSKLKIIENKLEPSFFAIDSINLKQEKQSNENHITVGIIGLLRYNQVIDFLEAVKDNSIFNVHIYGGGPLLSKVLTYVDNKRIFYFGEFKYPDDLYDIYKNIDYNFVMYNSKDLNVRLALPNKLYESIYFKKPIIVSSNTYLERKVLELGVGISCSITNIDQLPLRLEELMLTNEYNQLVNNCNNIPFEQVFLTKEDKAIVDFKLDNQD